MPSPLKSVKHAISYSDRKDIDLSQLLRLYHQAPWAKGRTAEQAQRMLGHTDLVVSAWAGEKGWDATVEAHRKLAKDRGNTFITLSEAELKRWTKATENVDDEWVKEVTAKGADGKRLLEEARALIKQYDK